MLHLIARSMPIVGLALTLGACSTKNSAANGVSKSAYAFFPAEIAYGGPLGRLQALHMGFNTDFDKLRICIETGKKTISDAELLFETKLAYAAWLAGAAGYGEDDWQKFVFVPQAKCSNSDASFAGNVVIVDPAKVTAGEELLSAYQPQHISCTATDTGAGCQMNGITLGWGGPGQLASWYIGTPDKWTKIEAASPSRTTLSPYVGWISVPEDIKRSSDSGLDDAHKAQLIATYQSLAAEASPSLASLASFIQDLGGASLSSAADPVSAKLSQDFYASGNTSLDQDYLGERGAFPTILHEVGHQYGMDHAHHPGQDAITGASKTAKKAANGQWLTDIAAMAYGLPYMYLTDDDLAGVAADSKSVKSFLATHKSANTDAP